MFSLVADRVADGTTKHIADVKDGDTVVSTDPETGHTTGEQVVQLHTDHDTDLTDLTVTTPDQRVTTLHTTQNHPFWSVTRGGWIDAEDLNPRRTAARRQRQHRGGHQDSQL